MERLFVYGTLMSTATSTLGTQQRLRLSQQSTVLGPATTPGLLVDLGSYPGLVLTALHQSSQSDALVYGELIELHDPNRCLKWLDAYEGIIPGNHPHNEYFRSIRPVTLANADATEAWVYIYQGGVKAASVIDSGRWEGRTSRL